MGDMSFSQTKDKKLALIFYNMAIINLWRFYTNYFNAP
jgi:hypothetical protein